MTVFACLIIFSSWKVRDSTLAVRNVFDEIKPCFELTEFISTHAFVDHYPTVHDRFIRHLRQKQIDLRASTANRIKIGTGT